MGDFYSQAFNFGSLVAGGVDPRTGLYNINLPLAHLVGNYNLGPALTISLNYSPLDSDSSGLGRGCSLGLSQYDAQARLLTVSSGERYKVLETATQVTLRQKKLESLNFEKLTSGPYNGYYKITHKSGEIELLRNDNFNIKVPTLIFSPTGRKLELTWESYGPIKRLVQVSDESSTLFTAVYGTGVATITIWPGRSESYSFRLYLQNGYLTRLDNTSLDDPVGWTFAYTTVGGTQFMTGTTGPLGAVESVLYNPTGQRFPDAARRPALPCVTQYTLTPQGGQPPIIKTYQYSNTNYLGYGGGGGSWSDSDDYIYGILTNYTYYTREISAIGDVKSTVERTYNNFHLMTQEKTSQGQRVRTTTTAYYAQVGVPFDRQPAQFQLPQTTTMTFQDGSSGGSRSEILQTQFDAAGNPTRRVEPEGMTTEWTYFPAAGQAGQCPPEPNGFVRLMKSETYTPPSVGGLSAPVRVVQHTYDSLTSAGGAPVPAFVVKRQQDLTIGGRLYSRSISTYVRDTSSAELGRVTGLADTLYAPDNTPSSYTSSHSFAFSRTGDQLAQTVVFTAHDSLTTTEYRTQSRFSGRLQSATDAAGNEIRYVYDRLGRILSRTINPGTAYENTSRYEYGLRAGAQNSSSTTMTDASGTQTRRWVDGIGRLLRLEVRDPDGTLPGWLTIQTCQYDAWGRLQEASATDFLRPDGRAVTTSQSHSFDDWGQNNLTTYSDGHQLRTDYDPVTRRNEAQITAADQGREVTQYNVQNLPTSVARFDRNGTAHGAMSYVYDGLGRLCVQTDALGQVTRYSYDQWNRATSTTLPDGTVVTKSYAPHSKAALVTGVAVNGRALGEQSFDGLGRQKSTLNGGRRVQFAYSDTGPHPTTVTTPDNRQIGYQYDPKLNYARTQVHADDIVHTLSYDLVTAALTGGTRTGGMAVAMSHYPSGLLRGETIQANSASQTRRSAFVYSLCGRPQTCTDVSGIQQQTTYDALGRLAGVSDPDMSVAVGYDAVGRMTNWTTTDRRSGHTLTTRLTFDDFNREIRREISGADSLVIGQEYRANNQLSRRTTDRGGRRAKDERYTYDSRNRLVAYACAGNGPGDLPVDYCGQRIGSQTFQYDELNNITKCTTSDGATTDVAEFSFSSTDPMQLVRVTHTSSAYPARIDLAYDAAGRLVRDQGGRVLNYDALGRISRVDPGGSTKGCLYHYDAFDRLAAQELPAAERRELYYRGTKLANEIGSAGGPIRFMYAGDGCLAQRRDGAQAATKLLGCDDKGSIQTATEGGTPLNYNYTPYGYHASDAASPVPLGYDGERQDPVLGVIHLGMGYRAYNPMLMRFNTPDNWSPFGAGGINPYAYCHGDPINLSDPSGHLSWQAWTGIGLSILGLALTAATFGVAAGPVLLAEGFAAGMISGASAVGVIGGLGVVADVTGIVSGALEEANPEASAILGWVSLGAGLPGLGAAGVSMGRFAVNRGTRLVEAFSQGLGGGVPDGLIAANKAASDAKRAAAAAEAEAKRAALKTPRTIFENDAARSAFMDPYRVGNQGTLLPQDVRLSDEEMGRLTQKHGPNARRSIKANDQFGKWDSGFLDSRETFVQNVLNPITQDPKMIRRLGPYKGEPNKWSIIASFNETIGSVSTTEGRTDTNLVQLVLRGQYDPEGSFFAEIHGAYPQLPS